MFFVVNLVEFGSVGRFWWVRISICGVDVEVIVSF